MFQFITFPSICYFTYILINQLLPDLSSLIRKSTDIMDICSSPWLIAAYHVLHRLLVPRHSPYDLSSLTFWLRISVALLRYPSHKKFLNVHTYTSGFFGSDALYCLLLLAIIVILILRFRIFLKVVFQLLPLELLSSSSSLPFWYIYIFFNVLSQITF